MAPENPYAEGAESPPMLMLFDVTWANGHPSADFSVVRFPFEPIGQVKIRGEAKSSEKEVKNSNPRASRVELKGYESQVVEFEIELLTDDPDRFEMSALDKFENLYWQFRSEDDEGRNRLFGIRYPLTDKCGIEMVFFKSFDAQDNEGEDRIVASCRLKEVTDVQAAYGAAGGPSVPKPPPGKRKKDKEGPKKGKEDSKFFQVNAGMAAGERSTYTPVSE